MSTLKELGTKEHKDFAVEGCTDFKYYRGEEGLASINTDTLICLNHKQKPEETLEEFKLRVVETVYRRIEALYNAFPHEIEAAGITMVIS